MKRTILWSGTVAAPVVLALTIAVLLQVKTTPILASENANGSTAVEPTPRADVTFEEYQQGFWQMVDCAAESGWVPTSPPRLTSRRVYEYRFTHQGGSGSTAEPEREAWSRALLDCRARYFDEVQKGWELQQTMSPAEAQETRDFIGQCLRSNGIDAPQTVTEEDIVSWIRVVPGKTDPEFRATFNECAAQMQEVYGLRPGEIP